MDTEAQPSVAQAFGINAIPTLAVFRDGIGLSLQAGALGAAALDELIEKVRAVDMDAVKKQMAEEEPPPELEE